MKKEVVRNAHDLGAEVKAEYAAEKVEKNSGGSGCAASSLGMLLFVPLFLGFRLFRNW
jgi:hypothetical protein